MMIWVAWAGEGTSKDGIVIQVAYLSINRWFRVGGNDQWGVI